MHIQKVNKVNISELLALCYFQKHWTWSGMPDHTQQILHEKKKHNPISF